MRGSLSIDNLKFTYAGREKLTIKGINLSVQPGEFVLLTGPTGCGKSTLLKTLNGIIPHQSGGKMEGTVKVNGLDTNTAEMQDICKQVGMVFQSPDDQLFSTVIEDEVAFGLENLCLGKNEIDRGIDLALRKVGMKNLRQAQIGTLSGGQKQRVAIASVLAMEPRILALDEPLSQLDPVGAKEVLDIIKRLNVEQNITVILVEHRIHEIAHMASRILVMDEGELVLDEPTGKAFAKLEIFENLGLRVPEPIKLFFALGFPERPLTSKQAIETVRGRIENDFLKKVTSVSRDRPPRRLGNEVVSAKDVSFSYSKKGECVLKNIDLSIREGEVVALMGSNGSGKTTLLLHLAAILKPSSGRIGVFNADTCKINPYSLANQVGVVFQNPDLMLLSDTVWGEAMFGPQNLHLEKADELARQSLEAMSIGKLMADCPLALSRGQRLRTAVASIISMQPKLILLDEPTTGQDRIHIEEMMAYLIPKDGGKTVVFCTHDVQTAIRYADTILVMDKGEIIAQGSPESVFEQEDILRRANLSAPDSYHIAKKLGLESIFMVEELEDALKCLIPPH
ncbi:energy-coupling factor transporter ATPase [Candidatus Oleimmundimicrobium sp.]|uniref:ABC transporter ATP-binding protein n=1 Tax=Candidatus Oleimmundimicrobium sp. TaxID=3060597 RepID=UPI00271E4670|nr:energy-coupling factor transporter ATPase [Candidatus Oleimmundimicrobium sp.]MDO8886228.1 energy-coupling factor transporter ATPase [Candidatus Oleimmundimicrobium sp.]